MNKGIIAIVIAGALIFGCNKKFTSLFHRDDSMIKVNEIEFDYFTGKMKVDFDGEKRLAGVANLRMKKDSVIWISLSPGLGVEVARILITRDSISFIDKFNKKYTVTDFKKLSKKFDFEIDYDLVESVVLGNLVSPYSRESLKKTDKFFSYDQQSGNYVLSNSIGTKSMKLEKLQVQDTVSKSSILVNYGGFQLVKDQILPFSIEAKLLIGKSTSASTRLDIEYSKAEIETKPIRFPFNVPQKYERNEIE